MVKREAIAVYENFEVWFSSGHESRFLGASGEEIPKAIARQLMELTDAISDIKRNVSMFPFC